MKSFATAVVASAFALTATFAVAQADPHHPDEGAGGGPTVTNQIAPEVAADPAPQPPITDAACPDTAPMMMDMMMAAGGSTMQMKKMMELMQGMQEIQTEQLKLLQELQAEVKRLHDEVSP